MPLHRHDRAVAQQRGGLGDRVVSDGSDPSVSPAGRRSGQAFGCAWKRRSGGSSYSARQAGHIAKPGHRRARAVVGDVADDREARAAVGAVDERVAVAAVGGVEELGQAVGAGRRVGRRRAPPARRCARSATIANAPSPVARQSRTSDALDARERRRLAGQAREEARRRRRARPRPRSRRRARRCRRCRRGAARSPAGARRGGSRRPAPCPRRGRGRAATRAHRPISSQQRRATRWPAPPGCAGCAPSGVTTTWSASALGGDPAAVVADERDRQQPAPARLLQRGDHVERVAARREREQRVARAARRRSPGARRSPRCRCRWRSQ